METQSGLDLPHAKVHRARLILYNNWARLKCPTVEELRGWDAPVWKFCRKRGIVTYLPMLVRTLYKDYPVVGRIIFTADRRRFRSLGQRVPVDHLWIRVPLDPYVPDPKAINQRMFELLFSMFSRKARFMTLRGYDARELKKDGYEVITK